ncbi:GNAT family N-acetyltransferase [Niabella sp. 22666]|uniref:GNAT family N-acetyltransferase n=1 Tax=Niabella sp. 22666 TaxID=3453954 RepID=UPI003F83849B
MLIRKAIPSDAPSIAEYLFKAMEEIIYHYAGSDKVEESKLLLARLAAQPANQYSYEFTWVIEDEGVIVGSTNIYEGARLHELREPVKSLIEATTGKLFSPEDETGPGEWYLDCIGVSAHMQGKGVGSLLLDFLIEHHVKRNHQTVGLLVDKANPNAKRLYLRKGFKVVGAKAFGGKQMEHLQLSPSDL